MPEVVRVAEDGDEARTRAVAALAAGELIVAPTDTVYGLFADATNADAVGKLIALRGTDAPITVLIHNPHMVSAYVTEVTPAAERLIAAYWPGPITLVFTPHPELGWALGENRVALSLRMPADPFALRVLHDVGPLACTAAPAEPGDDVALQVDDGPRAGVVSTVVDVSREQAEVLRAGAVSAEHVAIVARGELDWGRRPPETEQENDPPTSK